MGYRWSKSKSDEKLLSEVSEEDLKTTKRVLGRYYEMLLHDNTNQD